MIVLSTRESAARWRESAEATIFPYMRKDSYPEHEDWLAVVKALLAREIGDDWDDTAVLEAFYERHNAAVRREAPKDRLLEWRAADGWEPLCRVLGLPVPEEPFPHRNAREEWSA
jgi:sulfotransferase family protein